MKKLSEYKDEEALEVLGNLIEPATEIILDKEVVTKFKQNKLKGIALAIKRHRRAVFCCLAALNGESEDSYTCNIVSLPKTILDVINDKELLDFFGSQGQEMEEESFGSRTTTGEEEE